MNATVSLIQGSRRYDNVARAIDLIADRVSFDDCRQVVIKPNLVSTRRQLASTHVEAVRAVLDFVRARYHGRLIIAEGAGVANTWEGYERFGYTGLAGPYDVDLIDLNADRAAPVQVYDRWHKPQTLHLARTIVESDLRISIGLPKTHDAVIVTLSLKNMIMGSLINPNLAARAGHPPRSSTARAIGRLRHAIQFSWPARWLQAQPHAPHRNNKLAMHQGCAMLNLNLARLAQLIRPHLAIIDGFEAMEGAGPIDGDPVDWRIALAGTDALAVDSLTTHLMGFDPAEVGYLNYCQQLGIGVGRLDEIEMIGGADVDRVRRPFRPHPGFHRQRHWQLTGSDQDVRSAQLLAI
jgi:uncharacterized protein (DUF362 family)